MKKVIVLVLTLFSIQIVLSQQESSNDIHINLGGPDVYKEGSTFKSDADYPSYVSNSSVFATQEGTVVPPASIFHTERYSKALGGSLIYTIPVPNGTYTVSTHHAELFFGKSTYAPAFVQQGQRVFDILIEGVLKKEDHDLYILNGNNPLTHTFESITVSDGILEFEFDASVQRSNVSGISVEGANANVYVNVGSEEDVTFNDKLYIGDVGKGHSPGSPYVNSGASTDPLLQTERYMASGQMELNYNVPVPNGTYTVRTHHNELYFGKKLTAPAATSGQRVFDIVVEGVLKESDFDLAATNIANGAPIGNAITLEFTNVAVTDGILNISLVKDIENPNISGIAIERSDTGGTDIYINAGGPTVSYDNKAYVSEATVLLTNNSGSSVYSNVTPVSAMFTSERYATSAGGTLSYTIPVVPNQTYAVQTHHNELYFGKSLTAPPVVSAGQRVFDISVEEVLKINDFDLYVKNQNNPYTNTFENVSVGSDGILNIDFDASVERANVAGISVVGPSTNIHINAGSSEGHTFLGDLYSGDVGTGPSASSTFTNNNASTEAIFKSERYMQPSKSELTYGIPVPNGTYTVKTHHNELWFGKHPNASPAAAGKRVFDISVEGVLKKDDFDLAATNIANSNPIGNPIMNDFTGISVTDGTLNLSLTKNIDNPNLSAISIERTDAGGTNIYINVGGDTVTYQGSTYLSEQSLFTTNNSSGNVYNNDIVSGDLFQSERYATSGTLDITVPVENGVYTVETYHNELWFGVVSYAPAAGANKRVKDITIEGTLVEDDFDLYTHTSGTNEPTILVHENIEVTDGQLDLTIAGVVENPNLNGFSITRKDDVDNSEEGDEIPIAYQSISLSDENYILTREYHSPMSSFSPVHEKDVIEHITYFDAIGRPVQQIQAKASQEAKDIVTHIEYDPYGRQAKGYLPFEGDNASSTYRSNAEAPTISYYQANYPADIGATPNPFSQNEYESSPLNRVSKQAAPGEIWQLSSGHETRFEYNINDENDVVLFTVIFEGSTTELPKLSGGTTYYQAGELRKNIVKDENWNLGRDFTIEEYTDKEERLILKRSFNNELAHDTYYVYDDLGNLTFVIPPKINISTTASVGNTQMSELCYQYRYDKKNRLIEKKVPGKSWEYFVYNKLDQQIMTKDSQNPWLFTKYDAFERIAYTGFASGGDRSSVQNAVDSYSTQWTNQIGTGTTIDGQSVYYDNGGYPSLNNITELHTVNYYDNYNTSRDGISKPLGNIQEQVLATDVKGLPTVSKVRVLETNDWIVSLTAYDSKGRPIYSRSQNAYSNTTDIVETKLDFAGKVVLTETSHQKNGESPIISINKTDYDHSNRILKQRHEVAGNTEMIFHNSYDGIGQLRNKKVGRTKVNPLQDVNYAYNIRGWLTDINDVTDTHVEKLFNLNIGYTEGTNPLYDGNISQTKWRTANLDNSLKTYDYTYDDLNRIKSAVDNTGNYNLSNATYDKNGNITALKRQSQEGLMDDLIFGYIPPGYIGGTNKLSFVNDTSTSGNANDGFKDGANSTVEYTYDTNGNMISDANKGISSVTYNHLNLPTKITISGVNGGTIDYKYSADGAKLKKELSTGRITEYASGYVYENNVLQFFPNAEGYVSVEGGNYKYIYNYTDNLGNVRLSYTDNNGITEILEENNYYPFGLKHKGYNDTTSPLGNSFAKQWKLGNKEFDQSFEVLNTYDFGARNYDPTLARWSNIDNLAEEFYGYSPYNYVLNNPILMADPDGNMPIKSVEKATAPMWSAYFKRQGYIQSFQEGKPYWADGFETEAQRQAAINNPGDFGAQMRALRDGNIAKYIFQKNMKEMSSKSTYSPQNSSNIGPMEVLNFVTGYQDLADGTLAIIDGDYSKSLKHFASFGAGAVLRGGPRVLGNLGKAAPKANTWNSFQKMTRGQFSSRADAGTAWSAYKQTHGIITGSIRSQAQKSLFLRNAAASGKYPKWMNQWLQKGNVPPGHSVDHRIPLSIGGADLPSNMRLLDNHFHYKIHHAKGFYTPWLWK